MDLRLLIVFFLICTTSYSQKGDKPYARDFETKGAIGTQLFTGFKEDFTVKERNKFISKLKKWRKDKRKKLGFDSTEYSNPDLDWLEETFVDVQMMTHDRYFYDPKSQNYTVDRYLNDLKRRYGGIDAVLLWPTYPNMGVDDRNQFDLFADMPGGKEAVKEVIEKFHDRGVRVYLPIMAWDTGTREVSESMATELVKEAKELGADGLNGDTMPGVTKNFKKASDSINYSVQFLPELMVDDLKMLEWNTSGWGYWWDYTLGYPFVPGISISHWFEPSHRAFANDRWADGEAKTDVLQYAFFNGSGYSAWENIFGVWNQISDRQGETIRRIATIYRQFPHVWNSRDWEPFVPTINKGVFASKFPTSNRTIYTFVNREDKDRNGKQMVLPYKENMRFYDLWNGKSLKVKKKEDSIELSFPIEAEGYGAILQIDEAESKKELSSFLKKMREMTEVPLQEYSPKRKFLSQKLVYTKNTGDKKRRDSNEMVLIPGTKAYNFESEGVYIEGDDLPDAGGVQYPWEKHPVRGTKKVIEIDSFYIDKYPVTNKEFKEFLDSTDYYPKDDHNFLKDWEDNDFPENWDDKPVTWVSIEDARAYARWAGKRLPHEWEWQYAAQGKDGRAYPWGNEFSPDKFPETDTSRVAPPPSDIGKFPEGSSPFGVEGLVGHVWQWTDEYKDEHNRFAVVKGGSNYRASGDSSASRWYYFPYAFELNKYGKYLLMAPSLDRSSHIGFRLVKDKE